MKRFHIDIAFVTGAPIQDPHLIVKAGWVLFEGSSLYDFLVYLVYIRKYAIRNVWDHTQ